MGEYPIYLSTDLLGIDQMYYNTDTLEYSHLINNLITSHEKDRIYFSTVLKFGYNYDNRTPYKNIKRVLPNQIVRISSDGITMRERRLDPDIPLNPDQDLYNLLIEKVKLYVDQIPRNEHEIGVLLSGGIDSSIISSILLQLKKEKYFTQELRFFSVNNGEDAKYIQIFEEAFGISSTMLTYDLSNINDEEIKKVLKINETPVDLGSLFPTYVLFQELQKQGIKYIFTGDGPDELFGGYRRIDEYDSQLSDIFQELSFYHFPRLNKLSKHFGIVLKTPWVDEEIVQFAVSLDFDDRKHKKIMKESFIGMIPSEIINREKRPLKNDLIRQDERSYRNKLVRLFYEVMEEAKNTL